ncbi:MAG: metallophosphoesterase family protein [Myxococcaceae bacterium]
MRVFHCSDVHITGNYSSKTLFQLGWRRWPALMELRFGGRAHAYVNAQSTLARLAQLGAETADHFILSGDVTAYALEEEFQGAQAALGALAHDPKRCTVIPGNHDVYTPEAKAARRFERHFGHLTVSDWPEYCREEGFPFVRLLGDAAAIVGLCSARVPALPGFSFGWVGDAQRQALSEILADKRLSARAVLVVVHHAPKAHDGGRDRPLHGLKDADALMAMLPGPRFAILHGHIHKRYHHPATAHSPHIFGAGTSTAAGKEGYWLIDIEDGVIRQGTRGVLEGAPG